MLRDIYLLYTTQLLRYLAPMVLLPFYGRVLGVGSYGQLLTAMALMQMVMVIVEWGFPSTGLRDVAAAQTAVSRGALIAEQLWARLFIGSVVFPLTLLIGLTIPALSSNVLVSIL